MQLICEAYAILKATIGPSAEEFAQIFADWNKGELELLPHRNHREHFRQEDPETGQAARRCDPRQGRPKGHRQMDGGSRRRNGRAAFASSAARSRRASFPRMKDERVAARKSLPGPDAEAVHRRPRSAHRSGARRALREQNHQLRAGLRAARRGRRALRLESELRRHRQHLARRLHHPRELPESTSPRRIAAIRRSRI